MLRSDLDLLFEQTLRDRQLLAHPFYRRWEAGELHPAELAAYAGQYRHFEQALPEVLAEVVAALPAGTARSLVQRSLDDELGRPAPHLALFDEFAAAVGAPAGAAATAATTALVHGYRQAAAEPARALAMLAAYEVQASAVAVSKADGLRARYGLGATQTRFWDVHGTMDVDHGSWALDALEALGADETTVAVAADAGAQAWWSFLDEREAAADAVVAAC